MFILLRRLAVGLVAALLGISQAVAGESHAAAAAGSWSWAASAGDGVLLVAAPRTEARPGRLHPGPQIDLPPPARLAWPPPALVAPPATTFAFSEPASSAPPTVVASGRSARGPPDADDS